MDATAKWGYSSAGRAPALQAGGHEFESRYLHENHLSSSRGCHRKMAGQIYLDSQLKNDRDGYLKNIRERENL